MRIKHLNKLLFVPIYNNLIIRRLVKFTAYFPLHLYFVVHVV